MHARSQTLSPIVLNPVEPLERAGTESPAATDEGSTVGLVELMLKDSARVERHTRDESRQPALITRFLAISLVGFTIFGVAATVTLNASQAVSSVAGWPAGVPAARWSDASRWNLILAYDLGLVASIGVVLPSLYFFGLLAGVSTSMLGVVAHAMKGTAVAAVTLVGILPIYLAVVLGMVVFDFSAELTRLTVYGALVLPFLAGLNGVRSLYVGFTALVDSMPAQRRCRRACLLRRLVFAWSATYTAVGPLMVYTIWTHLS